MKDTVEKVLLQINGGNVAPSPNLMDRELYIHTKTGYLYVGRENNNPYKINSGMCDKVGTSDSTFYLSANDTSAFIGGIEVTQDGVVSPRGNTVSPPQFIGMTYQDPLITGGEIVGAFLQGCTIKDAENISSNKVSSNIVVVGRTSYGTEHPSDRSDLNPVEGQIYFKIS